VLLAFGVGVLIWHRVGLGAVLGAIALLVSGVAGYWLGWIDETDMLFAIILAIIVLVRHQRNLRDSWYLFRH
jgi:Co/Zn/Cd efflux system component